MVRGNRDDRSVTRDEEDAPADPLASSAAAAAEGQCRGSYRSLSNIARDSFVNDL